MGEGAQVVPQMARAQADVAEPLTRPTAETDRRSHSLSQDCGKVKAGVARVEDGLHEVVEAVQDQAEHERGIPKQRVDRLEEESHQERAEGGCPVQEAHPQRDAAVLLGLHLDAGTDVGCPEGPPFVKNIWPRP